jgi:hypothetical protein
MHWNTVLGVHLMLADMLRVLRRMFERRRKCAVTRSGLAAIFIVVAGERILVDSAYVQIVEQFARGEVEQALAVLARWNDDRTRAAVNELGRDTSQLRTIEAAVMLETELSARAEQRHDSKSARFHLDAARSLIDSLARAPAGSQPRTFQSRWFVLLTATHVSKADLESARTYVAEALRSFPNDPQLRFLSGAIQEATAMGSIGRVLQARDRGVVRVPRDPVATDRGADYRKIRGMLLETAISDYRAAITFDPAFMEPWLRIGRILSVRNDPTGAQQHLEHVIAASRDVRLLYLAHLFLGRVFVQVRDLAAAQLQYEEARKLYPTSQVPFIAGAELADRRGLTDEARQLLDSAPSLSSPGTVAAVDDPWWTYLFAGRTQAEAAARWLREAIRP